MQNGSKLPPKITALSVLVRLEKCKRELAELREAEERRRAKDTPEATAKWIGELPTWKGSTSPARKSSDSRI